MNMKINRELISMHEVGNWFRLNDEAKYSENSLPVPSSQHAEKRTTKIQ